MSSRRSITRHALAVFGALALLLPAAILVFADAGTLNLIVADRAGFEEKTTDEGAIVAYIGDQSASQGSSGTGVFESFVRIQASPSERGYNTNGTLEFDTKSGNWTHAIKVSDIPVVTRGGANYWELWSDINESNSTPRISLNEMEIFFASSATLTGYGAAGDFGGNATKVYDFSGSIQINDVNQGSGRGDLRYLVPLANITLPSDCGYKNPACATWFVLYTQWGAAAGTTYASDGGFEEWKVKQYPYVYVAKTATTTYDRDFDWTITKDVTPGSASLFDGQTAGFDYTIVATKGAAQDSNFAVSGTIAIQNPTDATVNVATVTDSISGGVGSVNVSCPQQLPYALPRGQTLTCTYSSALPNKDARVNTATVTLATPGVFTDTADITFGDPTNVSDDSDSVNDTINAGDFGPFTSTTTHTYSQTYDCSGVTYTDGVGTKTIPNTATLVDDGDSDGASVTLTCYRLGVEKTATTTYDRDFDWTITKDVNNSSITLSAGGSTSVSYTIVATKGAAQDSSFAVSGNIVISNPASMPATVTSVTDSISGGVGAVSVSCPSATVPAKAGGVNGTLTCTYSKALPDKTALVNTATAVAYGVSYSDTADITFGDPTNVTDNCAAVSDSLQGNLGTVCGTTTFTYNRSIGPYGACGQYTVDNTATVTEADSGATDTDDATVTVNVENCGNLFHTGTTCAQYYLGAPAVGLSGTGISEIEYSLKRGKINQVNPGVFFYYTEVTATGSSVTGVLIDQSTSFVPMSIQNNNQVRVYDGNCNTYSNFTFSVVNGDVTLTINGTTAGNDYIISVKYDPANLVGLSAPNPSTQTYTFQTVWNGTSGVDSLDLKLK